ncbi:Phosphoadenosine phosphosulfate reductase [subsurface metagenome]
MGLEQLNFGGKNKVEVAINILRRYEPPEGYYLAFSGGKDLVAIYDLAQKSGVKFDAHYCVSPIDPPQIYKFIKEYYPDVIWDIHAKGFWKIVDKKGLPMRTSRWCCQVIKEAGGKNRSVITGVRRVESVKRRSYPHYQKSYKNDGIIYIRPILDFDNYDIWAYIADNKLPYCSLYDEGFKRLGCVLCPFTNEVKKELEYFPKIARLWKLACDRKVAQFKAQNYITRSGKTMRHRFETGQELFDWWVSRS